MSLRDYLLTSFFNEEQLDEVLAIDFQVEQVPIFKEELLTSLYQESNKNSFSTASDIISDGNLLATTRFLCDAYLQIENLFVDRCHLGYYSWLIAKINQYMEDYGQCHQIYLDTSDNYVKYKVSKNRILILGEEEFVQAMCYVFQGISYQTFLIEYSNPN